MRLNLFFATLLCVFFKVDAQIAEDFEDETLGNTPDLFTPTWSGSTSYFLAVDEFGDNQLRSNAGDLVTTEEYFIATPSQAIHDATWEFFIDLKFNPSGANFVDVFLASDTEDLGATQNGYFVRIGDTEDWIAFHKIVDGTSTGNGTPLLNTAEDILNSSASKPYKVSVTVDDSGLWELLIDEDVTGAFTSVGTITDTDIVVSNYFGIFIEQSGAASVADGHFFDDVVVTGGAVPDTTPPSVISANAISATQVDIQFSESLDEASSETLSNYALDGGVSVVSADLDGTDPSLVHLTVSEIINGTTVTITVSDVEDEIGNAIVSGQVEFRYLVFSEASFRDVQINEFLVNSTPSQGLPEADFVELYNPTNDYFNLENWSLSDISSVSNPFGSFTLDPGAYLIICANSDVASFETFGSVLGVGGLPTFNESGDRIILKNSSEIVIDQLIYDSELVEEGVSAEQVNPLLVCSGSFNFDFSTNAAGGTPGAQNSVFTDIPDETPPSLVSAISITLDSVRLVFDEYLNPVRSGSVNVSFNPSRTIDEIYILEEYPFSVLVKIIEPLESNTSNEISVSNVSDCSNNFSSEEVQEILIGVSPENEQFREVQINEFMVGGEPDGLPEGDYLELFNSTDNIYDLTNWTVSDAATQSDPFGTFILQPNSYVILCANSQISFFEPFGDVIGVGSFPNFNSSQDEIIVENSLGNSMDRIDYSSDVSSDGISNEQVNSNLVCSGTFNFLPSLDESGGTPGTENSVLMILPDNFSPKLESARGLSQDSLRLDFDEFLNFMSVDVTDFSTSPTLTLDTIYLLSAYPQSVFIKTAESIIGNTSYTMTAANISDCAGNLTTETSVDFLLGLAPEDDDILLSEILFNPVTASFDFVEIYNPSSTENFELRGWKLARMADGEMDDPTPIAEEGLIINPGSFLFFSEEPASAVFVSAPTFVQLSIPAYSDDKGTVLLLNANDEIVQQFDYLDDYHYALLEDEEGVSLERVSYTAEVNDPNNWRSAASTSGFQTPGKVNSQSITQTEQQGQLTIKPKVFLPGNTGSGRDFTTINYQFTQGGQFANVTIYDQSGRPVKQLASGASLATSGFLRWDGTTDRGGLARMGYYVVLFEVFNGNGKTNVFKETVVVGRDF